MDPATFFTELKRRHSRHQREIATSGSDDYEIHYDKHGVVAPSVCSWITPQACAPDKNLLLNRAEHYQYQTGGSELRENAKITPRLPATSAAPRKMLKPLLIPMSLLRASGSLR